MNNTIRPPEFYHEAIELCKDCAKLMNWKVKVMLHKFMNERRTALPTSVDIIHNGEFVI